MPLFDLPNRRNSRETDRDLVKKSKSSKKPNVKSNSLLTTIEQIRTNVDKHLGKYKNEYMIIDDKDKMDEYMAKSIENRVIAIDTETTGLDPIQDKIVGICLYTPGMLPAYVPINHISYITGERLENQLTEGDVAGYLVNLLNTKYHPYVNIVMFNAKFDIRVIRNQLYVKQIRCDWDCYLASRLMNENELQKGLKALHQKYVLNDTEDEFKFDALFKGITFDKVPINSAYLYAAHDAVITYELYEFQKKHLYYDPAERMDSRNGMNGVAWVFFNIEMPCIEVVADMEDIGIELDLEYAKQLSTKYNLLLEQKIGDFYSKLDKYQSKIDVYNQTHPNSKLDNPINIGSPTQIAILLYDILGLESPDSRSPRGTGEPILAKMDNDICKAILDYREIQKLLSTYIDKLPHVINPNDRRIHCNFNQYGADTGRFSSSDPNLQNIPSHNKEIRRMFKATNGYVLMSSDYSQQEPKVMTQMCGDPKMIDAYRHGKDLYAEIASLSFNTTYENCLEFRPDGTTNPEGKERRSQAKSILLGVLYGRGVPSIAEQLGTSTEKAQKIKDSVFKGFPAIPKFEHDSLMMAEELGYVTTLWGRKRRLPDLQLPEYEFKYKEGYSSGDVLDFDEEEITEVPEGIQQYYLNKLRRCKFWEKRKVFEEANKDGIWIIDNGGKIADAERQCVNARIQGSAADMSKLAMIKVGKDARLKELGFRLLIPVHDELIAECPEENAKECSERFAQLMSEAATSKLEIPIKCDVEITRSWYGERVEL